MKVILVSVGPPQCKIVVDRLPAMLGRDETAEICLADSWVGHFQCILDQEAGKLRVLDLGTRTGTFVNGVRIKTAELMPGDTLTVGRTDFSVEYEYVEHSGSFGAEKARRLLSASSVAVASRATLP